MNQKANLWAFLILGGLIVFGVGGVAVYRHFKERGIRNNNPGNLVKTSIPWTGKVPAEQNTDSRFEQFRDYNGVPGHIWGLRALFKDVRGDVERKGLNTIRRLIGTYAPPHENNTAAYIATVAAAVGISADAPIAATHYPALVAAIVKHENGVQPYPAADIARAIALA